MYVCDHISAYGGKSKKDIEPVFHHRIIKCSKYLCFCNAYMQLFSSCLAVEQKHRYQAHVSETLYD